MKALLVKDATGIVRILTTDDLQIYMDMTNVSADAEEIGLVDNKELEHGFFYLWEGECKLEYECHDAPYPTEVVYDGILRVVQGTELLELMKLEAPDDSTLSLGGEYTGNQIADNKETGEENHGSSQ